MTDDIVTRLRRCQNDPMWADHAEVNKATLKAAADEIDRLRTETIGLKAGTEIAAANGICPVCGRGPDND